MKKRFVRLVLVAFLLILPFASAVCEMSAELFNQDPYPAVPGEYVKLVFQLNWTEESDCKDADVFVKILPEYPFILDSNEKGSFVFKSGNYVYGYQKYMLAGFKIRVDERAIKGDNKLKLMYGFSGKDYAPVVKEFLVNVKEVETDFEVRIQDYSKLTNTITFGIVNTGKTDAKSLVFEVPFQENIKLKGSGNVIIGSLNSNDDTTATIKGIPKEGEIIVRLTYNDENDVRRVIEKKVQFIESLNGDLEVKPYRGTYFYLFWIMFAIVLVYYSYGYYKKRKEKNNRDMLILRGAKKP
ncbi:MAG: hypothetical protein N3D20_02935 [Candidatus Pacearchaeota archaeon]|nr:hypothetical protein [Candidatus Pacearchaeota archaeon]